MGQKKSTAELKKVWENGGLCCFLGCGRTGEDSVQVVVGNGQWPVWAGWWVLHSQGIMGGEGITKVDGGKKEQLTLFLWSLVSVKPSHLCYSNPLN